jgi:hypothetical protein
MGIALSVVGCILLLYGWVVLLIHAFKTSVVWGIFGLLFGPVLWVFAFMNWAENKVPFLAYFAGFVLVIAGTMMMAPDVATVAPPPGQL